jgi:hypothetical protein
MKKMMTWICIASAAALVQGCRTVDPIQKSEAYFPAAFAKKFTQDFYEMDRRERVDAILAMFDPQTSEKIDKQALDELSRKNAQSFVGRGDEYELEVMQEASPQDDFRFVYLLKKEDFSFFRKHYRKVQIDRVICVKRGDRWFVYGPPSDVSSGLGLDTVYTSEVKDIASRDDLPNDLRSVVEEDYGRMRLVLLAQEMPEESRKEVVDGLMRQGVQFYDGEKYREAIRLFKKAYDISDGASQEAEAYIKRCQKAIEMGM